MITGKPAIIFPIRTLKSIVFLIVEQILDVVADSTCNRVGAA